MKSIIQNQLKSISAESGIKILFACESGSRAWGFPSPDSDYDVRFIYLNSRDWYLGLNEKTDVVQLPVSDALDINGWDLRKAIRLLAKGNVSVVEWLLSPEIYFAGPAFHSQMKHLAEDCFSPPGGLHHYLSMAEKFYETLLSQPTARAKDVMYCLRATLSAEWIGEHKTPPPVDIQPLMAGINCPESVYAFIQETIRQKASQPEAWRLECPASVMKFLQSTLGKARQMRNHLPGPEFDFEMLNRFFIQNVNDHEPR